MTWTKRMGLGALAGLLLYLVDLYNVGFQRIVFTMPNSEMLVYVAALVAAIPFMLGGGVWAMLHKREATALRIFESGLVVPALFLALSNGSALGVARQELFQTADPRSATTSLTTPWARPAWQGRAKIFPTPKSESDEVTFLRAITGVERTRVWYVVAGSERSSEEAQRQADSISAVLKQFKAEVYRPYGENPFFKVVIGAELPFEKAVQLRDKAIDEGIETEPRLITHRK